jgi:hypothetical protein
MDTPTDVTVSCSEEGSASYEFRSGLAYGAHLHRYTAGRADANAHAHGDALTLRLPTASGGSDTASALSWAELITEARIAATANKTLFVVPDGGALSDAEPAALRVVAAFIIE